MLDYRTKGTLKVDMISYINGTLEEVPKDMKGHAVTLVASYLFKVNTNDPVLLSRDMKEFVPPCHHAIGISSPVCETRHLHFHSIPTDVCDKT